MPPCRAPPAHPRARLWQVDPTSNMLIAVPGGNDGPGGVLVCSENFIVYKNHGHADKRCALPRRRDLPTEHGLLLVSSAVHRQRDLFFILVQSEFGDLYKVTLGYEEDQVSEVKVRYLDSVPVCSSLCILKSGFLFCAAEFGNHGFYQFQGVGDDEDSPLCTSAAFDAGDETVVELEPRPLRNLLQARKGGGGKKGIGGKGRSRPTGVRSGRRGGGGGGGKRGGGKRGR